MSFSANIENASSSVTTLVSIRPRKRITDWTVNATYSNVYQIPFTDLVVGVYADSYSSADEADSLLDCSTSNYSWYHDGSYLYFNPDASGDPNSLITVVEWDLLVATDRLNWYRDPILSTSGDAIWEGGLVKPPVPTQGYSDLLFGYSPIQITTIDIQIADGQSLEHLYDWSLYGSRVKVWECVGELKTENISELFIGAGGNFSVSNGILSIEVSDPLKILEQTVEGDTFSTSDFPNLNPNASGHAIRKLYGFVRDAEPTNVDYNATASPTVNREWIVCAGDMANAGTITRLINHTSGNNTATTTQLFDASGFQAIGSFFPGDKIIVKDNGVDKYTTVLAVNYTTNVITHTSIGARTPLVTDNVRRGFVGSISIVSGAVTYSPMYGRDYTEQDFASNSIGFVLADNFEATLGMPTFDPADMTIGCRAYGSKTLPKKLDGVTDFGALSDLGGTYSNPVTICWDILTNQVTNFKEVVLLDETGWQSLSTAFDRPVGVMIPSEAASSFPTWKSVIQELLQCELLKLHFKCESGIVSLTITQTGTPDAATREASSENMRSIDYSWDFSDIVYKVVLTLSSVAGPSLPITFAAEKTSDYAKYLHRINASYEADTLHQFLDDANTVADRVLAILNERRGSIKVSLPIEFIDAKIDEAVTVSSDKLPGYAKTGLINSRDYVLLQHTKSPSGVSVVLDDQKGINDFGGW